MPLMQCSMSKRSSGSSRSQRQTSGSAAAATSTHGSTASRFAPVTAEPNCGQSLMNLADLHHVDTTFQLASFRPATLCVPVARTQFRSPCHHT